MFMWSSIIYLERVVHDEKNQFTLLFHSWPDILIWIHCLVGSQHVFCCSQIAREHRIPFLETSAKANVNVEKAFLDLAQAILEKVSTCGLYLHLANIYIQWYLIERAERCYAVILRKQVSGCSYSSIVSCAGLEKQTVYLAEVSRWTKITDVWLKYLSSLFQGDIELGLIALETIVGIAWPR